MPIGIITVEFRLSGCRSLKEKRHRLSGLRARVGRHPHLAVCESDFADLHQRSEWTFVALASDKAGVSKILNQLERQLEMDVDAEIIHTDYAEL